MKGKMNKHEKEKLWMLSKMIFFSSERSSTSTHDPLRIDRQARPPIPPHNIGRSDLDPFGFDPSGSGGNKHFVVT